MSLRYFTCPNEDRTRWRIVALGQPGLWLCLLWLCPICVSVCQKACQEVPKFDGVVTLRRAKQRYLLGAAAYASLS